MRFNILLVLIVSVFFLSCKNNFPKHELTLQYYNLNEIRKDTLSANELESARTSETPVLGKGYNTATNQYRGFDVVSGTTFVNNTLGVKSDIFVKRIYSYEDLRSAFSMDIKSSVGFGGIFEGEASFKHINELSVNAANDYLLAVIHTRVKNEILSSPHLSEEAQAVNENDFLNYAGDEYVSEIEYGGDLYILVEANSISKQEKEQNQMHLEAAAKFLFMSGSASSNISSFKNSLSSINKVNISVFKNGDKETNLKGLDIDSILNYALSFESRVIAHPVITGIVTKQYSTLPNSPSKIDFNTILDQKYFIEDISNRIWKLQEVKGNARYSIEHQTTIANHSFEKAKLITNEIDNSILLLRRCAEKCSRDIGKCDDCKEMDKEIPQFHIELSDGLVNIPQENHDDDKEVEINARLTTKILIGDTKNPMYFTLTGKIKTSNTGCINPYDVAVYKKLEPPMPNPFLVLIYKVDKNGMEVEIRQIEYSGQAIPVEKGLRVYLLNRQYNDMANCDTERLLGKLLQRFPD